VLARLQFLRSRTTIRVRQIGIQLGNSLKLGQHRYAAKSSAYILAALNVQTSQGMPVVSENYYQRQWPTHPFPATASGVVARPLPESPEVRVSRISSPRDRPSSSQLDNPAGRGVTPGIPPPIAIPELYSPARADHKLNRGDSTLAPRDQSILRPVASIRVLEESRTRRTQEAPFQCNIPGCGATFTREYNLNRT
jgi:hypothetical protein